MREIKKGRERERMKKERKRERERETKKQREREREREHNDHSHHGREDDDCGNSTGGDCDSSLALPTRRCCVPSCEHCAGHITVGAAEAAVTGAGERSVEGLGVHRRSRVPTPAAIRSKQWVCRVILVYMSVYV